MKNQNSKRSSLKKLTNFFAEQSSREFHIVFSAFLILILFQQIAGVSAGYFLNNAINSAADIDILKSMLWLFLVANAIDFFMVIPIRVFEVRACVAQYRDFVLAKLKPARALWASDSIRERYVSGVSNKAYAALTGLTVTTSEIFRFSLSILLNSLLFSTLLDASFVYAIVASISLSAIYQKLASKFAKRNAAEAESAELSMFSYLQRSWDSVILGNAGPARLYQDKLLAKIEFFRKKSEVSYRFSEIGVCTSAMLSMLPLGLFDLYFFNANKNNFAALASLIVLLPRQVTIINNIRTVLQFVSFLRLELVALETVESATELSVNESLSERITVSAITVNDLKFDSIEKIVDHLLSQNCGRFTIRGANGAGKSSLLFLVSTRINNSFVLPAASRMETGASDAASVGQRVLSYLKYAMSEDYKSILLDEWDANLDAKNTSAIDNELNILSKTRLVIEIRHSRT